MNRTDRMLSVLLIGSLLLLLAAAGLEQRLNGPSARPIGTWLFQGGGLLLAVVFLLRLYRADLPGWTRTRSFLGFILLLLLPLLYAWNPSHSWQPAVGLLPVANRAFLPAAAYVAGAWRSVWLALAAASVLGACALLRTKRRDILVGLIVLLATGAALWVLRDRAIPRQHPVYEWTGWFVSRNHFAAFACLVFPVVVTTGLRIQRRAFLAGKLSSPAVLYYVSSGILALGVLQTGSRAGMAILAMQAVGLLFVYGMQMTDFGGRYRLVLGGGSVLLVALLFGFFLQRGGLGRIGGDLLFRFQVVRATWGMWQSNMWWGTGPQSFAVAFPYYQSEGLYGYYFHHAHNDPLQILGEWGVLGAGWMLLGGWLLLQAGIERQQQRPQDASPFRRMEASGLVLAVSGVLLHSLVDFPLQHPQILLLACVWIGMLGRVCRWSEKIEECPLHQ